MPELIATQKEIEDAANQVQGSIQYARLAKVRNPEYKQEFWAKICAFYKGGVELLDNDQVMDAVFPRHVNESERVYEMRKKLAHYTNHTGAIVNHLLGKLMGDPLRLQSEPEPDDFYNGFLKDCSPPTGHEMSINELVAKTLLSASLYKCGYVLVEMPNNLDAEANSLAEQEESGQLDTWCCPLDPSSLIDWQCDKAGEFEWVLLCFKNMRRESPFEGRDTVHEQYWYYDRDGWIRWDVKYKMGTTPNMKEMIPPTDLGMHSFGRVPVAKLELPDGLWIGSKLESLAREYFNKRNALSWAEFKALMPVLYEYLDPGVMPTLSGPGGEDDRATNQKRSPAHTQQRQAAPGQGDRAEWLAPPHAPFEHALKSCDSVRDEMHRVVQQMALSADNKGSMLRRSEGSKKADSDALDVVLDAYGKLTRKFSVQVLQLVEAGRGDKPREWTASGHSKYDNSSSDELVEEETVLDTVELPSPTFKAERKKQLARKLLGDSVNEKKLEEIDKEIEEHYSSEGELADAEDLRAEVRAALGAEDEDEDDDLGLEQRPPSKGGNRMVISTFKGGRER